MVRGTALASLLLALAIVLWPRDLEAGGEGGDSKGLPEGEGREEVARVCSACHSLMLVEQQRLSREVWDETLRWMVEEQGMPALAPEARESILDYLATHYSPETPR